MTFLALDCIGEIISFLSTPKDFLNFYWCSKYFQNFIDENHPACARHLIFRLRSFTLLKKKMKYVHNLHIYVGSSLKKTHEILRFFPNLRKLTIRDRFEDFHCRDPENNGNAETEIYEPKKSIFSSLNYDLKSKLFQKWGDTKKEGGKKGKKHVKEIVKKGEKRFLGINHIPFLEEVSLFNCPYLNLKNLFGAPEFGDGVKKLEVKHCGVSKIVDLMYTKNVEVFISDLNLSLDKSEVLLGVTASGVTSDKDLNVFRNLKKLKSFNCFGNIASLKIFEGILLVLENLVELIFSNFSVNSPKRGSSPVFFVSNSVERFKLVTAPYTGGDGLAHVDCKGLKNLKHFFCQNANWISNKFMDNLPLSVEKIEIISTYFDYNLDTFRELPNLKELKLDSMLPPYNQIHHRYTSNKEEIVESNVVVFYPNIAYKLEKLSLLKIEDLSGKDFHLLGKIRKISIKGATFSKISDKDIEKLEDVEELEVNNLDKFRGDGLLKLKNLKKLKIRCCFRIKKEVIDELMKKGVIFVK